jgi:Type I phosphodiesterase / nucleotide pyrophosphatase
MTNSQRVVLLEFNELTPSLMSRFIETGRLPNFKRFYDESLVFTTVAAEREPHLEPWIQWVTVHTGLNYQDHKIFHLNEGHGLDRPRVWEILAEHSLRSWICGSMNVRQPASALCDVLPDPWCTKVTPQPEQLKPFFAFVQQNVLEHTNNQQGLTTKDYLSFLRFMALHGLSSATVRDIVEQLIRERQTGDKWKRVVLLDRLQCDVFQHYFVRHKPHFSTLFLNSTAHYQHAYWDSMDPEAFSHRPSAETVAKFEKAIQFGYEQMDELLGRIVRFAGPETTVVFTTGLSQQAAGDAAYVFYRPRRFESLPELAGVQSPCTAAPVMTQQFYLEFQNAATAAEAHASLQRLTADGRPLLEMRLEGHRIFTGCARHDVVAEDTAIAGGVRPARFGELFYLMETGKTGIHHPYGLFWVRTPAHRHAVEQQPVPLAAVAPTLLSMFGVTPPSYMAKPVDVGLGGRHEMVAALA